MTTFNMARQTSLAAAVAIALMAALPAAMAQTATTKPAAKTAKAAPKAASKAKAAPVDLTPPATPEQVDAAQRVYYGVYECEMNQKIDIVASPKHESYVEVKHGKMDITMKPVLSSTGAIRLEDVRGETLMVQIAAKSMLLNVKTGQRLVDACVSPKQRELMEAAAAAKAAESSSASAMTTAAPAAPKQ